MNCKYDLLLIRGAPGVGKSSLAAKMREIFPQGTCTESQSIWQSRNTIDWLDPQQCDEVVTAAMLIARYHLKIGLKPNIIVDVFYGERINYAVNKIVNSINNNYCVITLLCSDKTLLSRIEGRKNGWKDIKTSLECNKSIHDVRCHNEICVDTNHMTKDQVLEFVISHISV